MTQKGSDKRARVTLRALANTVLKGIEVSQPPVTLSQVVSFIKKENDLQFYIQARDFSDRCSGVYVRSGGIVGILYNKNHSEVRQRFTVAHELGHLLLGHSFDDSEHKEDGELSKNDPREIEANQFAAELLMPYELIKKEVEKKFDAQELANKYNVSVDALWYRITSSNGLLLKK